VPAPSSNAVRNWREREEGGKEGGRERERGGGGERESKRERDPGTDREKTCKCSCISLRERERERRKRKLERSPIQSVAALRSFQLSKEKEKGGKWQTKMV
jgi:hypothetical protein